MSRDSMSEQGEEISPISTRFNLTDAQRTKSVVIACLLALGLIYIVMSTFPNHWFALYGAGIIIFGLGIVVYNLYFAPNRVAMTKNGFKIGNSKVEIFVPYSDLAEVCEGRTGLGGNGAKRIVLKFKTSNIFGTSISFMPLDHFLPQSEIAKNLRMLIE